MNREKRKGNKKGYCHHFGKPPKKVTVTINFKEGDKKEGEGKSG